MAQILVVDDSPVNRELLLRRLQRRGYVVHTAEDGAEAVAQARELHPDLILMDMSLPVLDGWSATRQLRADPQTAAIPIIALTGHDTDADREKALAAGCDEFETKPVNLARLLGKIETLTSADEGAR